MKHTQVKLTNLNSWADCQDAIEDIKADHKNSEGGMKAWCSGYQTYLLKGAQSKIDAIEARQERLWPYDDSGEE